MITFILKCCPLCKRPYHSSVCVCVSVCQAQSPCLRSTVCGRLRQSDLCREKCWSLRNDSTLPRCDWGLRWPMWHIDVQLHHHREAAYRIYAVTWWQACCLFAISLPLRVRRGAQLQEVMCNIKLHRLYKGGGQRIRIRWTSVCRHLHIFLIVQKRASELHSGTSRPWIKFAVMHFFLSKHLLQFLSSLWGFRKSHTTAQIKPSESIALLFACAHAPICVCVCAFERVRECVCTCLR